MKTIEFKPLSPSKEFAIEANSLEKVYLEGIFRRRGIHALHQLTFTVPQGQIFGLLGPNGAGKTTFIKVLLGIIRKTGGWAKLLGSPAGSQAGRRMVGYLPEQLRVPRHLTGLTALEYYGNLSDVPTSVVKQRRERLLEMVGLTARAKDRVSKYSKGMQQRLGLAQAMLHDPKLLILDEPTDGLDPRARAEVRSIIPDLRDQGTTIFLNSHILQEVEMVCDHVAILDRGHLRYCGPVREIGEFVSKQSEQSTRRIELTLDLISGHEQLNSVFTGDFQADIETFGAGKCRCRLHLSDQHEIDMLVDKIREADISLVGLSRKQITLEDAFLSIVESNQTN